MPHEAAKSQLTPERWQRIRELFAEAVDVPFGERDAFLTDACGEDTQLRSQVEDLLRAHEATEAGCLDHPPHLEVVAGSRLLRESIVGCRIGAYRIENEIARGGMGTVYRAVRADESYSKQVAIKLVDRSMLSRRSAELFRHERQILAGLEHPNIARLLDGGASEDGSPYLVMEYVEGETITNYCDAHRLEIEERLKLFQKICSAVHFAHQNLVIHRDIKPANILVTAEGEPKLLDFGIAKVIDAGAAQTQTFAAMTPAYASPEQLNGQPVTTATDIYSLGLVLYELLTGRYAYEQFTSPVRRQQAILDEDPERPSQVVLRDPGELGHAATSQQISALRRLPAEKLSRRLAGDLECIVSKAIRKEPEQRYTSVAQFSEDISRHLRGEPVIAHQSTVIYRSVKWVRRHKLGFATGLLMFALLVSGVLMIVRAERKARAQQLVAERRFNDLRKVANSLIFEVHDSIRSLPGATSARKIILQRAQEYLDSLAADAKSDPALLRELSAAYIRIAGVLGNSLDANLGNSKLALQDYRKAAELREAVVAGLRADRTARRELAESYMALALAFQRTGQNNEAKASLDKANAILEPLAAADARDLQIRYDLAKATEHKAGFYTAEGKLQDAYNLYLKDLAMYEQLEAMDPGNHNYRVEVAFAHKHLGGILIVQKQLQPALEQYRAALEIDEAELKADPQSAHTRYSITFTYSDTGYILGMQGKIDEALAYYRKALAIRTALADADPQDTRSRSGLGNTYSYIGGLLWKKRERQEALAAYTKSLTLREALSQSDPDSEQKRLAVAESQEQIGEAYAEMAFDQHRSASERLRLCQSAESFLQKALPLFNARKSRFVGTESDSLVSAQKAADQCNVAISQLSGPSQTASAAHFP